MNLPEYIQQIGATAFSRAVECSVSAAHMYRRKERTPHREIAQRIVDRTPVTWEGIYGVEKKAS